VTLCFVTAAAGFETGMAQLLVCGFVSMIIGLGVGHLVASPSGNLGVRALVVLAVSLFIGLAAGLAIGTILAAPLGGIVFAMVICAGVGVVCRLTASALRGRFLLGMVAGTLPWVFIGAFCLVGILLLHGHR
jgi:hypothetical protein